MREEIDTNDNYPDRDIPDGEYDFKIESIKRREKNGKPFYSFKIEYDGIHGEQVLFSRNMGPLLRILGCTETLPGKFEWDPDLLEGKMFHATIKHEVDKKGNLRQQMTDFKEADVPF